MHANLTLGNSFARLVMSSLKMNPTPTTRLSPLAARCRSALSRSEPSPGSMYCTWTPSSSLAFISPRCAESLNDLSPRPPTSNTSPIFVLAPGLAGCALSAEPAGAAGPEPAEPTGCVVSPGLSLFSLGARLQPDGPHSRSAANVHAAANQG